MRPSLIARKQRENVPFGQTAMSAIAHHTDIDSPPLANLPALSRVSITIAVPRNIFYRISST
jgi:hypothetical protein